MVGDGKSGGQLGHPFLGCLPTRINTVEVRRVRSCFSPPPRELVDVRRSRQIVVTTVIVLVTFKLGPPHLVVSG